MNIYEGLRIPIQHKKTIVSVGTFDGVHRGHMALILRMKKLAQQYSCQTLVITFNLHPRLVLNKQDDLRILTTTDEKLQLLKKSGIDNVWVLPFTREFAELSYRRFVEEYLAGRAGVGHLVIGYDHAFGKGQGGDYEDLLQLSHLLGFSVERIEALTVDKTVVGSTLIRERLLNGDIPLANHLLGYQYSLSGEIVRGNQIGKLIGFPTANLNLKDPHKLIPAQGVYACFVDWKGNTFKGMCNIGLRPTIDANRLTIEANIFDFDRDIYNDEIKISLIQKTRNEKKFGSLQLLKSQLMIDKEIIQALFSRISIIDQLNTK